MINNTTTKNENDLARQGQRRGGAVASGALGVITRTSEILPGLPLYGEEAMTGERKATRKELAMIKAKNIAVYFHEVGLGQKFRFPGDRAVHTKISEKSFHADDLVVTYKGRS